MPKPLNIAEQQQLLVATAMREDARRRLINAAVAWSRIYGPLVGHAQVRTLIIRWNEKGAQIQFEGEA